MTEALETNPFRSTVEDKETKSEWLKASESYEQALSRTPVGSPERLKIAIELAYSLYLKSLQAKNRGEFRNRIREAVACLQTTMNGIRSRTSNDPQVIHAEAMLAYLSHWLATSPAKKKRLIEQTWALAKKTLQAFKELDYRVEYGRSYNQLCTSAYLAVSFANNFQSRLETLRDAAAYGEKAVELLTTSPDPAPLVRACVKTASYLGWLVEYVRDMDEKEECLERTRTYWMKAMKLSEELAISQMASVESYPLHQVIPPIEVLPIVEKALDHSRKAGDGFATASTLDFLVCLEWDELLFSTQDHNVRVHLAQRAIEHSDEARHRFQLLNFTSPLGAGFMWNGSPKAEYHFGLAQDIETDSTKKVDHLEKGLEAGAEMMRRAKGSRYPEIVLAAHDVLSKLLAARARMETGRDKRRKLLLMALEHRIKSAALAKRIKPYQYFMHAQQERGTAEIKSQLAGLTSKPRIRIQMLRDALAHHHQGIELGRTDLPRWERHGWKYYVSLLATEQFEYADLLSRMFELTKDRIHLQKATRTLGEAGELFHKLSFDSRVAECHWKASTIYDLLGEQSKAIEGFQNASKLYLAAAESIPELSAFYQDHSIYMSAWSEIEKSRYHHARGEYGLAGKNYETASNLLKTSSHWNYLSSNYAALSHLENGEDHSRREGFEEATREFENALRLFQESQIHVQTILGDTKTTEEQRTVADVREGSMVRAEYCRARKNMEEAVLLGRNGDHGASAERYGIAIETLERIREHFPSADGPEMKYAVLVSKAWQMAALAEKEGRPVLYRKAAQLFEQSNRLAHAETTKILMLGHARLCKALSLGLSFLATGNPADHNQAGELLEHARRFYLKAGFHNASEHVKATRWLFDACSYLNRASNEPDEEKKAKLYLAAEQLLKFAVEAFNETGHKAAKEQALKLLESAREEKEVTLTLTGVFQSQPMASPSALRIMNRENPVGVERFHGAYVEANVLSSPDNPRLGEPLSLRIELANAGMAPAQLLMVEKVIPEGFEVLNAPSEFPVQGHRLILNGRRLDPLKTQRVDLILRPKVNGPFELRPRLSYVDENGKNKFQEVEPFEITVDQSTRKSEAPLTLSSPMMKFLIDAFIEDYMRKRLSIEHSGWRGLPEIMRSLKIPRSQVYGDQRYNHTFGKPLERLVKAGVAEFRIFPGGRGRGGNIVKVRASYDNQPIRQYVDNSPLATPRLGYHR